MVKITSKIREVIVDSIFPNICICGKWGKPLCDSCCEKLPKNRKELCPICLRLSKNGKTCSTCRGKSNLTGLLVFGKHEGMIKKIIWNYKYEAHKDLCFPLSKLIYEKNREFISSKIFIVTNVPISVIRRNWRGFNQSELIAREISKISGLKYIELLEKLESAPQVGLTRKERIKKYK